MSPHPGLIDDVMPLLTYSCSYCFIVRSQMSEYVFWDNGILKTLCRRVTDIHYVVASFQFLSLRFHCLFVLLFCLFQEEVLSFSNFKKYITKCTALYSLSIYFMFTFLPESNWECKYLIPSLSGHKHRTQKQLHNINTAGLKSLIPCVNKSVHQAIENNCNKD